MLQISQHEWIIDTTQTQALQNSTDNGKNLTGLAHTGELIASQGALRTSRASIG